MLRRGELVTPLELFFDLVFVLAITQCSALMAADPTWHGLAKGLVVLGVLWWAWVGYAWLTSVVDPEEGAVRLAMFAAMAALLVAALCVPDAFGDLGLTFAASYGVLRLGHLVLFGVASRDEPRLRRSVWTGLVPSTAVAVGLLAVASQLDGSAQGLLWVIALTLDMGGPFVFGSEGWKLVSRHFAERHGLIFIIALGESVVAIGVGADHGVDGGVITGAVLGVGLCAAMWWAYFDVAALVTERRLATTPTGRAQNEMARDAYSYLHYPMVAGVVLVAMGLKQTLGRVGDPLDIVPAVALAGGVSLYLLAHVAVRVRVTGALAVGRLTGAVVIAAVAPLSSEVDALIALALVTVLLWALIAYEGFRFADERGVLRHGEGRVPPRA